MSDPPFIADITIPPDTWTYPDWLATETGTFAEIANAIGAALTLLGVGLPVSKHTAAGAVSVTTRGLHFIRKTVPALTTVTIDQGISGFIGIYSDSTAGRYPVTVAVASGGTINGQANTYLATPGRGILLTWIGSGDYGIVAVV